MLLVSAQYVVTLGQYDVQGATYTMARFVQQPREGHINRSLRFF